MKNKTKLDTNEVKHVAKLANLGLNDQEITQFQKDLSEILDYVEVLKEIPTENVEPTSQVTSLENILREDKAEDSLSQEEVLSGTSKTQGGRFKIKRILNNN